MGRSPHFRPEDNRGTPPLSQRDSRLRSQPQRIGSTASTTAPSSLVATWNVPPTSAARSFIDEIPDPRDPGAARGSCIADGDLQEVVVRFESHPRLVSSAIASRVQDGLGSDSERSDFDGGWERRELLCLDLDLHRSPHPRARLARRISTALSNNRDMGRQQHMLLPLLMSESSFAAEVGKNSGEPNHPLPSISPKLTATHWPPIKTKDPQNWGSFLRTQIQFLGGAGGIRTLYLNTASVALSRLSYSPVLSGFRSYQPPCFRAKPGLPYFLVRGSSASRRPSPRNVKQSISVATMIAGQTTSQLFTNR